MSLKKLFHRDRLSTPVGQGVVAGITEAAYIVLVAVFIAGTETVFSSPASWNIVFGMVSLLVLLVMSVAISGALIFGWPARYFMEKKYKESLASFLAAIATMFVVFAVIFLVAAVSTL